MSTFILIALLLFFGSAVIAFIINKKKENAFESALTDEVAKSKKLYKGSLSVYTDNTEEKTILRFFVSKRSYQVDAFIPSDEIMVNDSLFLFDKKRKKLAIIESVKNHKPIRTILFSDIMSLQPVEISKQKKVTRGGISPISVAGYRWASSTTRMQKQVERVYIDLKYKVYGKDNSYEIEVYNGIVYEDWNSYDKIVTRVNTIINEFHDIIVG